MSSLTAGISQRQYAAIGKVANEWSHVDSILRHYIAIVTKIGMELSEKITAGLSSTQLLDLLLTILYEGSASTQSPLYEHLAAAKWKFDELRGKRNTVVHLDWVWTGPGQAAALKATSRGKWALKKETWSTMGMESLATEIKSLADVLWQHLLDAEAGRLRSIPHARPRQKRQATQLP